MLSRHIPYNINRSKNLCQSEKQNSHQRMQNSITESMSKTVLWYFQLKELEEIAHHPAHATNRFRPKSGLPLAKLNKNVYIITVGSATPKINKGWPPTIECIIPQRAVDAKVWTAVRTPSESTRWKLSWIKSSTEFSFGRKTYHIMSYNSFFNSSVFQFLLSDHDQKC